MSEGYEVSLSYPGDRLYSCLCVTIHTYILYIVYFPFDGYTDNYMITFHLTLDYARDVDARYRGI